jgi:hypothetical protein
MRTEKFEETGMYRLYLSPEVLKKDELNGTERLLLIIIASLDNDRRGCHLSNSQLAWLAGCSPGTVSKSVKNMRNLNYIIVNKQSNVNGGRCYMRKVADFVKRKPE